MAAAVQRLLSEGAGLLSSSISVEDLLVVRRAIHHIEHQKYVTRHSLLATTLTAEGGSMGNEVDYQQNVPLVGELKAVSSSSVIDRHGKSRLALSTLPSLQYTVLPSALLARQAAWEGLHFLPTADVQRRYQGDVFYNWLF